MLPNFIRKKLYGSYMRVTAPEPAQCVGQRQRQTGVIRLISTDTAQVVDNGFRLAHPLVNAGEHVNSQAIRAQHDAGFVQGGGVITGAGQKLGV